MVNTVSGFFMGTMRDTEPFPFIIIKIMAGFQNKSDDWELIVKIMVDLHNKLDDYIFWVCLRDERLPSPSYPNQRMRCYLKKRTYDSPCHPPTKKL